MKRVRKGFTVRVLDELIDLLLIRSHIESCKTCRKKYSEIIKHAKESLSDG